MKKIVSSVLILLSTTFAFADTDRGLNAGVKVGTLGLGIDFSTPIYTNLSARLNMNGASYTYTQEEDDNEFEGTLELQSVGTLLDYYPFENNFRVTGGLYYNGNSFDGTIVPTVSTTIDIDGMEYTTDDLTKLDSELNFDSIAPYLGLGWGNDARDKGWGFTFDLGLMYHGVGDAELTPDIKDLTKIEEINAAVEREEQSIENDLEDFPFYPVISVGVNYTF